MARGRHVWMTETGHALYGGEPGLSDTYISSIWWLDQLGLLAREGVSRVFRQSLVGSDYGLIDQDTFEPRPDYYASFLWKRLMGNVVFRAPLVEGQDGKIRAYHHTSATKSNSHCLLLVSLRSCESLVTVAGSIRAGTSSNLSGVPSLFPTWRSTVFLSKRTSSSRGAKSPRKGSTG